MRIKGASGLMMLLVVSLFPAVAYGQSVPQPPPPTVTVPTATDGGGPGPGGELPNPGPSFDAPGDFAVGETKEAPSDGGTLPFTGGDVLMLSGLGLGALGIGLLVRGAGWRRGRRADGG